MTRPLHIDCVGGGPGGLYFGLLMKKADPRNRVRVFERNRPDDTFGFGVVFSDQTMAGLAEADEEVFAAITAHLVHWDDIAIHYGGEAITSTGHGFSGMSRHTLLRVLHDHAHTAGVEIVFEREVTALDLAADADLVVASDGANSTIRRLLDGSVETTVDLRPNRFVWLGTSKPFPAFTFYFRHNDHGLWRVHAYQYAPGMSTFIVECREETWRAAGLENATEDATVRYLEALFADHLQGHPLTVNKSIWRQFPTIRVQPWSVDNVVLIGDAAHTAHFSVGSGTRLAMEDAVALQRAVVEHHGDSNDPAALRRALESYETSRRPQVESLQRAAQASLQWFEDTERYMRLPPVQFAFALLTRSLRITHEDLKRRDPAFVAELDAFVECESARQVAGTTAMPATKGAAERQRCTAVAASRPPMFTPFRLRDLVIPNRIVVSPMCQYTADDGAIGDWHLVHLGSRAMGGAGLVMAEMTAVGRDARISLGCAGLYNENHTRAWKRVVDFVHGETDCKIGVQLGHAGRKAATLKLWEGDSEPLEAELQWPIVSASPIPYFADRSPVPREMTRGDMDQAISDYVRATKYALEAGFDLLEIHMAHGYLLASFISPLTNTREDEYGVTLEGRMRFPLEVFAACRREWPEERPMSARISAVDWVPGGIEPADSVEVARMLRREGCDVVDVSAGQTVPDQRPVYGRLFQTPFADRIRHEVCINTMAVGNISSYMDVNTIIAAGRADLCLLARAHLFDPYWARHAAYMQRYALPWPDPYKSVERYVPRFEFHFGGEK